MEALVLNLQPIDLPLGQIYLDPNNPRFGEIDTPFVPDGETAFEHHQAKAISRLLNDFAADKLKMNMEVNGFLPIDRVIVRKISDEIYVVLEGNRRIAAAKSTKNNDDQRNQLVESVFNML